MGALLKLPFFTTDRENEFFAILDLTFHSWSPFIFLLIFYKAGVKNINHVVLTQKWLYGFVTCQAFLNLISLLYKKY